ncbi:MAG: hypothetical protein O7I93_19070, partial [Gemmatimonadetes bacterium]|nr:hypothetical protein [Gemmatimonadota bacterium]
MHRFATRGVLVCALSALTWGCNENTAGTGADGVAPTVAILMPDTVIDRSQGLQFTVNATDNISLLTVGWSVTGPVLLDSTTTFSATTPAFTEAVTIPVSANSGTFIIIARATDGSGLAAIEDTVIATIDTTLLPTAV